MRSRWLLAAALGLTSCSADEPPAQLDDFALPAVSLTTYSDFCTEDRVLDAAGGIWKRSACEHDRNPRFIRDRIVSASEAESVRRAFDALPRPPPERCWEYPPLNGRRHHRLAHLAETKTEWIPCPVANEPSSGPGTLPDPYDRAKQLLLALAP